MIITRVFSIFMGRLFSIAGLMCLLPLMSCAPINNRQENLNPVILPVQLSHIHTLDIYQSGDTIHSLVSGVERSGGEVVLKYQSSKDAGVTWSTPSYVNKNFSSVKTSKRGNDFQLAANDDSILAAWKTSGSEPWVGILVFALSKDAGQSWQTVPSPIEGQFKAVDQGYFDLNVDAHGNFHLVWLDDREEAGDTQGLRYAQYASSTGWQHIVDLEHTACTCCWSRVVSNEQNNVHVLYRDDQPRDMRVISSFSKGKSWQSPHTVADFGWEFIGCPHQGGAIATKQEQGRDRLYSLVWNGEASAKGLYFTQADAARNNWSPERQVGGKTAKSGDLAIDGGRIGITYTVGLAEQKQVVFKLSEDGGETWSSALFLSEPGVGPSHPRIVSSQRGFRIFWTEWLENGDAIAMMSALY